MGSVNARSGKLYLDFRYKGQRCREQTQLEDTPVNRKKLKKVLGIIEKQIALGCFDYGHHFPDSSKVDIFRKIALVEKQQSIGKSALFSVFSSQWQNEKSVEWRESQIETVEGIFRCHLLPTFGDMPIGVITKSDILSFRLRLCEKNSVSGKSLSVSRINHIMTYLRLVLNEAAERLGYDSPWKNIKALPIPRSDVSPFSLEEVKLIIRKVRADYRPYYTVRFFTGMRTGEVDGLTWDHIDFKSKVIHIHQSLVRGKLGPTKTSGSYRTISVSSVVCEALKVQWEMTGNRSQFVFCSKTGEPLNYRNVTKRVWYPLLKLLGLDKRNPYQTRHTAATLWLAAGENPEWIARQLGHANTAMLFRVYSRYVPNLMKQDGSAFESMLDNAAKR